MSDMYFVNWMKSQNEKADEGLKKHFSTENEMLRNIGILTLHLLKCGVPVSQTSLWNEADRRLREAPDNAAHYCWGFVRDRINKRD